MSKNDIEATYPLSSMQQGMLFNSLYAPQSGVDIEQMLCTLHEDLDAPAFKQAWQQVVERHPVLRTSFRWEDLGEPVQDVHRHVELLWEEQDWRGLSAQEQENRLKDHLQADRKRGFNLTEAPLMRVALFRMGEADYKCVWTFHHSILDGRSHPIILKEVFAFYAANCQDQILQLESPPLYRDYIAWYHDLDSPGSKAYWQEKLKGFTASTPLPMDSVNGTAINRQHEYGEQEIRLSETATSVLRSLAEENRLTLNTFVQGAWALLLSRYTGEEDIVFGATRAGRYATVPRADEMVGNFINTLPVRIKIAADMALIPWLQDLRAQHISVRDHEHTPLVKVQSWSEVPPGTPLFESIIVFDNYLLDSALRAQGESWKSREFRLIEQTNYPLTVYGYAEPELLLKIVYDRQRFDEATIARLLGHIKTLLEGMAAHPHSPLSTLPLLTEAETHQLLVEWNDTQVDYPKDSCIHHLFEAQVERTPDAVAVIFEDRQLTYRELNSRANQLAHTLRKLKVGPETRVGIYMERSLDMIIGLLAILKAGGAYVPLDPTYPADRIAFMVADAEVPVLVSQGRLVKDLPPHQARVVTVDASWDIISAESEDNVESGVTSDNLSYVIYTSGSTGKPKGVMLCHRNVVNFFVGMDERIPHDPPGVWLAVTSLSFDISVLELLWTLSRGFKVVIYADKSRSQTTKEKSSVEDKAIDFSLFYFASDGSQESVADKYHLLLEGAKFGDKHGFSAIWTPERHFHAFGGLYPNPSVASAAIASITEHIKIRSGSCVLPLHNPIRVAEEWALVDNLSKGRVGISFAAGWQPNDFVLRPENYANRKEIMFRDIEVVRKLWRGESVSVPGPLGQAVEVRTLPRPIQPELPIWITAAGNPETFRMAGASGFNILTHLLGQTVEALAEKLAAYRQAWVENGHPGQGHVTLMLHTYVGDDDDKVRETVRKPMTDYLRSSVGLVKAAAWHWPVIQQRAEKTGKNRMELFESEDLSEEDMEALLAFAFDRYFETSGLFGTPETCLEMVNKLKTIDVDEIACLIDFGVPSEMVLKHLEHLNQLKQLARTKTGDERYSIPALIKRHKVTHFQCTPSMASMLLVDDDTRAALSAVQTFMVGGEAFPVALATELNELMSGDIINMYGPTETTVWSSTYPVSQEQRTIPIGRPIANTQLYILDRNMQPVPVGVAGEFFIGGDGVARGYLNRPELTAERFIDDPFSDEPDARLYRTGDLARYRPDGNIEFLGRIDHQVKIRGHRIELGEIEAVLGQHPAVREAVVIAREDVPGDPLALSGAGKRLVAYIIPHQKRGMSSSELRDYLKKKLPEFMVPSNFVTLDAFPLTPNGKVNRRALPIPKSVRPELENDYVAPRSSTEKVVAKLWSQVLGIEKIGRYDNFFDLGGHSLSAVQTIMRIRQTFKVELPLQTFLHASTLAGLAEKVEEKLLEQTRETNKSFLSENSVCLTPTH